MPVALTGDQVFEVAAQDSQKTRTDLKFLFNVDVTGPAITSPLPAPGSITGQVITISANISDGAGLDTSSIQVLIGDKTTICSICCSRSDLMGAFSTLAWMVEAVTALKLPPDPGFCVVRPTISFRASDALGNDTTLSYEIAVDNFPPIADLVPPDIRTSKIADGLRCSFSFNPLSNKALSRRWRPRSISSRSRLFDLRSAHSRTTGNPRRDGQQAMVPHRGADPDASLPPTGWSG